jgi:F0F1-type ATP synthase membrane subunit b/b'
MIEQAKAAIESENGAVAELKAQVATYHWVLQKKIKEELSNKESQTKLVELLGT